MFGLDVPSSANTRVQIRLTLSRGGPLVAWEGLADVSDDSITATMLANRNIVGYLWAAIARGKLQDDELGFIHLPARVVALQNGVIVYDEKVTIPLMMAPKPNPAPTSPPAIERDTLAMAEAALTAMQRNASEVIAQVGIATVNALKEMNAAHCANMERAQQTLERLGTLIAEAHRSPRKLRTAKPRKRRPKPSDTGNSGSMAGSVAKTK